MNDDWLDMHFKTTDEMMNDFSFLPEEVAYEIVVENSNRIAELCDYTKQ